MQAQTPISVDLMAPVGSYESLKAAIQAGASSVYFGIERLNMRSRSANNFTVYDLENIVKTCKTYKIKSYLTVNTLIYDRDISLMQKIIDAAAQYGVDAIIASDVAAIHYANTKNIEVHISTQLNVANTDAVKFYARFADVIVLARELNLKQVSEIARNIRQENICGPSGKPVRIELFVHGALCMAVSGKCYLSLHEQNASANRGACLQTCRKSYIITEKESGYAMEVDNEYILSPKDLCAISFVDKILAAGVDVFKIEGRARSPEYVKTVTECYHEAIEAYKKGTYTVEKIKVWEERLATVFNRGFWDGYYLGRKTVAWSKRYGSQATKKKQYIGKGTNYFSKIKVAEFLLEAGDLQVNDEILITGPTTGVVETRVKEIRVDLQNVEKAKKGAVVSIPVSQKIRRSDKLYKIIMVQEDDLS